MQEPLLESDKSAAIIHPLSQRAASLETPRADYSPSTEDDSGGRAGLNRSTVFMTFAALAAVTFLLRIFYAGHLYQDDGLWFTAAEELTRGKALYSQIYFDKPPSLPLLYAALFKIFGAHVLTIRLFTIFYSLAISAVIYLFGSRLYGKRAGLIAAAMFTVFSTTYEQGHFQGLNTDFLMALPYVAGAYFFARSLHSTFGSTAAQANLKLAFAGGILTGVAFQTNPKGIFNLLFFAALLLIARNRQSRNVLSFAIAVAGFLAGAVPFWIYIAATGSLDEYRLYVWDWGARYAGYFPAWQMFVSALRQTVDYFALNSLLLIALAYVTVSAMRQSRRRKLGDTKSATGATSAAQTHKADTMLLLWLAASYVGLSVGGRFFGHYFFQILAALCLIGARGLLGIINLIKRSAQARKSNKQQSTELRALLLRHVVPVILSAAFLITMARFHTRTATLAADWIYGSKSASTSRWLHEELNREERMVAAVIKDMADGEAAADRVGLEAMRSYDETDESETSPSSQHLFVWGYRPEIYYWAGLAPASRFLSTQPLTGVPADVHYFGDDFRSILDESQTTAARAMLLRDLEQTQPEYIVDELGFFNSHLAMESFPELNEFLKGYKPLGAVGRFFLYRNKQFVRKYRERHAAP